MLSGANFSSVLKPISTRYASINPSRERGKRYRRRSYDLRVRLGTKEMFHTVLTFHHILRERWGIISFTFLYTRFYTRSLRPGNVIITFDRYATRAWEWEPHSQLFRRFPASLMFKAVNNYLTVINWPDRCWHGRWTTEKRCQAGQEIR